MLLIRKKAVPSSICRRSRTAQSGVTRSLTSPWVRSRKLLAEKRWSSSRPQRTASLTPIERMLWLPSPPSERKAAEWPRVSLSYHAMVLAMESVTSRVWSPRRHTTEPTAIRHQTTLRATPKMARPMNSSPKGFKRTLRTPMAIPEWSRKP